MMMRKRCWIIFLLLICLLESLPTISSEIFTSFREIVKTFHLELEIVPILQDLRTLETTDNKKIIDRLV